MIRLLRSWLLLLPLLLSACVLVDRPRLYTAPTNSDYSLLVAQQQWQVTRGDGSYRLQTMVQVDDARWTLVFMDSLGQRLATLVQDQQALTVQTHKSHPLQRHWPELGQRFQMIYWPLADLRQGQEQGWHFTAGERVREAFFSGILAGHVVYSDDTPWQGTARYTDNKSDLRLVIESRLLRVQER
ncbi:MAG: DUF3261 domain-containing protein [Cellvibrio sp.]|jgi:hypothetical protein